MAKVPTPAGAAELSAGEFLTVVATVLGVVAVLVGGVVLLLRYLKNRGVDVAKAVGEKIAPSSASVFSSLAARPGSFQGSLSPGAVYVQERVGGQNVTYKLTAQDLDALSPFERNLLSRGASVEQIEQASVRRANIASGLRVLGGLTPVGLVTNFLSGR